MSYPRAGAVGGAVNDTCSEDEDTVVVLAAVGIVQLGGGVTASV
jgi:hypothetical protein